MTQDTRKDRRVKIVSLNVRYKSATVDEFIENHALDVSRGGIYIKTGNPFPPGTLLKFEIRLASDQAVITGVGRVVWKRDAAQAAAERPAGMGVKFIKVDDPSKQVIDRLMNTRADAGRAFEAEPEVTVVGGSSAAAPQPAAVPATPRAAVPGAAVPGAGRTSGRLPPGAKATMVGMGAVAGSGTPTPSPVAVASAGGGAAPSAGSPTKSSATPAAASPAAPPRPTPSVPPRPGGAGMFPRGHSEPPGGPKQEQTVMKQAAELLEEALREAGGSMEDVGTNPLFGSGHAASPRPAAGAATAQAKPPIAAGDAEHPPRDEAATARAMVAQMAPAPAAAPVRAAPRAEVRSSRPAVADARRAGQPSGASMRPAIAASFDESAPKKGGATATWMLLGALAALVVVGVAYRDRLLGTHSIPEPVSSPSATASAAASAPPPPSASVSPPAVIETPSVDASPWASDDASTATAAVEAGPAASAARVAAPPPPAPRPSPRPRPPPVVAPEPTATTEPTGETSAPAPTSTSAATSAAAPAATATATGTAPSPASTGKKPKDDNPY
jgi:uncharacterized protein (TIGR02266 family)